MAKKEKRYVDSKNEALQLAESIGESQEEKTLVKKKKTHERIEARRNKGERRSSNNSRLEKAKEVVRARTAQMKKEKEKKHRTSGKARESSDTRTPKRKGVSFA